MLMIFTENGFLKSVCCLWASMPSSEFQFREQAARPASIAAIYSLQQIIAETMRT
jgi:hypothetical protein